jgi:glyoxalase family protein
MGDEERTRRLVLRMTVAGGNPADAIDLEVAPDSRRRAKARAAPPHCPFRSEDDEAHSAAAPDRDGGGMRPTPQIDRGLLPLDLFPHPGRACLFEIATNNRASHGTSLPRAWGTLRAAKAARALREALRQHQEPLDGVVS